jgi:hypothetical protein
MNFKNLLSQTITAFLNFKISRKSFTELVLTSLSKSAVNSEAARGNTPDKK